MLLLKLKPHDDDTKKMLLGYVDGLAYDLTRRDLGKVLLEQAIQLMGRIAAVGNEAHPQSVMTAYISHSCRGVDLHARAMTLAGWPLTEDVGWGRNTPKRFDDAEIQKALSPDSDLRDLSGYEHLRAIALKTAGVRVVGDARPVTKISDFKLGDSPRRPRRDRDEPPFRDESSRRADIPRHSSWGGEGGTGPLDRHTCSHRESAPRSEHYDGARRDFPRVSPSREFGRVPATTSHQPAGASRRSRGGSHEYQDQGRSTYSHSGLVPGAPVSQDEVISSCDLSYSSRDPPRATSSVRPRVFLTREERDRLDTLMRAVMRGPSGTCLPSTVRTTCRKAKGAQYHLKGWCLNSPSRVLLRRCGIGSIPILQTRIKPPLPQRS